MKHFKASVACVALYLCAILLPGYAIAGPYGDDLAKCLVKSTTTADKRALVKWMFAIAAIHPDVESIASVTADQRDILNRGTAHLLERLLTDSCTAESQQALRFEGAATFESSFQVLGQVAGRELFSDPKVLAGMSGMLRYLDRKKFQQLPASPWTQEELTEPFMRSMTKRECMDKTVASLKTGCSTDACLKQLAGISGDCVTWAAGDIKELCSLYDREYIGRYCANNDLDSRRCIVLHVAKPSSCKPAVKR